MTGITPQVRELLVRGELVMRIIRWLILGGFAGWAAAIKITGNNPGMSVGINILAGIIGIFVVGWILYGHYGYGLYSSYSLAFYMASAFYAYITKLHN